MHICKTCKSSATQHKAFEPAKSLCAVGSGVSDKDGVEGLGLGSVIDFRERASSGKLQKPVRGGGCLESCEYGV